MNSIPLLVLLSLSLNLVQGEEKCRIIEGKTILCRNATETDLPRCLNLEVDKLVFYGSTVEHLTQRIFKDLQNVTEFSASGAGIDRIHPNTFDDLYSLRWIDISSNNLKELSPDLLSFLHIKYFDVSDNQLVIPLHRPVLRSSCSYSKKNFGQCGFLEWLKMESNDIKEVYPETFKELTDLKRLSLARNRLRNLPELVFEENKKLIYLDLSGNKLKTLSDVVFTSRGRNTWVAVQLEGNPWVCDYKMTDFLVLAHYNGISVKGNVTCHKPSGLMWKDIADPARLRAQMIDDTEL